MRVNVHLPWWFRGTPPGTTFDPGIRFFDLLIAGLMDTPGVVLTVTAKPVRAHEMGRDVVCLNYHRTYGRKRNLNVKGAYLPGFFYVDRGGYSGWSRITDLTFEPGMIDAEKARRYYHDKLWAPILSRRISKYAQPDQPPVLPADYIFVPLQVPGDTVLKLAHFSQEDLVATLIRDRVAPVVIKVHPVARHDFPEHVAAIRALHDPGAGVHVVDGHVHDLILGARVVVCTNSGVGVEALLLGRPVITCGTSDYHHLTQAARHPSALRAMVERATAPGDLTMMRYATWLFGGQFIDVRDPPQVWVAEVLRRIVASR